MTDTCFVPLAGCLVWTDKWFFPASVVRSPFLVVVALLLGSDGRACVHKEGSAEAAVGGAPFAGCVTHAPTARGSRSLSVAAVLVGKQALKLPPCLPRCPSLPLPSRLSSRGCYPRLASHGCRTTVTPFLWCEKVAKFFPVFTTLLSHLQYILSYPTK